MTRKTRKRFADRRKRARKHEEDNMKPGAPRKVKAGNVGVRVSGKIPRYLPGCPGCPPIEEIRRREPDNALLPENKGSLVFYPVKFDEEGKEIDGDSNLPPETDG